MTPEPAQPAESPEAIVKAVVNQLVEEGRAKHRCLNDEQQAAADDEARAFYRKVIDRYLAATTARPTERGAVEEALGHLEWLCGIAYNQGGAHELGYDPLEVVRAALTPPVTVAATDQAGEVERSWSGDPHGLANELRRVAGSFGAGFRLPQLLRDAADEIDCLTDLPAPDQGADVKLRQALETMCLAVEYSAGCDEGITPDDASSEIMSYAGAYLATAYDEARAALDTQPATGRTMGGEAPSEDWLAEVLDDSLDMDWTGRVGAQAIIREWDRRYVD